MQRPDRFSRAYQLHATKTPRAARWLLGYGASGEIFRGLILSNDVADRRIPRGGMAHQLLLDVGLIIVMMGALHGFERRLVATILALAVLVTARPARRMW
jgi:hypothetical protein